MSSTDATDWLQGATVILASLMAIWSQYRKRNTARARMFLFVGILAALMIAVVTPFFVHNEREYTSAAGSDSWLQAATYPTKSSQAKDVSEKDESVDIEIPVVISGLAPGTFGQVSALLLSIETPEGVQWSSKWQSSYRFLLPGENRAIETFAVDYKTYQRVQALPLKARVSVAATIFHDQDVRRVIATDKQFAVAGVGWCWINPENEIDIRCHSPLTKPHTLLVRLDPADSTCTANRDQDEKGPVASTTPFFAWEWNGDSGPAEYGFSPVEYMDLYFYHYGEGRQNAGICPGTPLNLSFPRLLKKVRVDFEMDGFKLSEHRREKMRFLFGSGISITAKPK